LLVFIAALFVSPLIWIFLSSFKSKAEILANPWGFPSKFFLGNFAVAWVQGDLGRILLNSTLVTFTSTILTIICAAPAAYYFSRVSFRGKILYHPILLSMVIPIIVLMIPMAFLETKLNIINTYSGLILAYVALHIPLSIFILANFFMSLPRLLEEAALLDGACRFEILRYVILPISKPAIFSTLSIIFILIWNEFTLALVIIADPPLFTIPLALKAFAGSYSYEYQLVFASLVMVNLPLILVLVFLQKHFVKGILRGARRY